MRRLTTFTVLFLIAASSAYAQSPNMGASSGAMAMINSSDPSSTQSRVTTTPTVVAPGLAAAGVETCLGSTVGGLSLMGGGFTLGSTRVDEGCTIRLLARQLFAFGQPKAAMALMCQDEHVALAMATVGTPCLPPAQEPNALQRLAALFPPSRDDEAAPPVAVKSRPVHADDDHLVTGSTSYAPQPQQDGGALNNLFAFAHPAHDDDAAPRKNGFM